MRNRIIKHSFPLFMAAILLAVFVNGQSGKSQLCNPKCKAAHLDGAICKTPSFEEDTSLIGRIKIGTRPYRSNMMHIFGLKFCIADSLGISAERDSSGKWKITNAERALEQFYQMHIKKEAEVFIERNKVKEPPRQEFIQIAFIDTPKFKLTGPGGELLNRMDTTPPII
jgi:hypothetical protein